MPSIRHTVKLSEDERNKLLDITTKGKAPAKTIKRANILLASDSNAGRHMSSAEIATAYHTSKTTVANVRASYAKHGLEATLERKKRQTPPVPPKVTGETEAHIIALACGQPPDGYEKWSLRLLAEKAVEMDYVESISHTTIARTLKKTNTSHK